MNDSTHTARNAPPDVCEFNRRAAKALRSVEFRAAPDGGQSFDERFGADIVKWIDNNVSLTDKQQLSLFRLVDRYHRQIWDKTAVAFAQRALDGRRRAET
ncbi:hypothetical protein RM530_03835 [Algiphilus sp. W345]|uniref:Uncharacterized protein n=1 Tax=Banduia mediterranea TaxID=3075609 RepID=A0ABU2WF76_9GAMM|nr:hypothetical protein [Algiphilus sp. W345]MDT0496496.1 hypothetical protein [Algiphilus sp. W345]